MLLRLLARSALLAARAMPGRGTTLPPLHTRVIHNADVPFALAAEEAVPEVLSTTDMYGRTALHYAALTNNREAYRMLQTQRHDQRGTLDVSISELFKQ